MPYDAEAYESRAHECVKLANWAKDELVQMELLKLRQTYLEIARRLRGQLGDQAIFISRQ